MDTKERPKFLAIPIELRLEIYKCILDDGLREGTLFDVSSLFLACRTTHKEISVEFMRTIEPLLRAQHAWSLRFQFAHLRIVLNTPLHMAPYDTKLHIAVPVQTIPGSDSPLITIVGLDATAAILSPLFATNWAELRLSFDEISGDNIKMPSMFVHRKLLKELIEKLHPDVYAKSRVSRLVFNYKNEQKPISESQFWPFFSILTSVRRSLSAPLGINRAWISRTAKGWMLSMDLKEGLDPVEGAIWALADDDEGYLQITRLFGSSEETKALEFFEPRYTAGVAREDRQIRERDIAARAQDDGSGVT